MELGQHNLEHALTLLGSLLAEKKAHGYWLVVCGGSALLAQNLISRATHDVDVLAMRNWDSGVGGAYPLPNELKESALEVARELGLDANWLNGAASMHFPDLQLLPSTFWLEQENRDYGGYLRIGFVNRSGQILLKTYAALNRAQPRDLQDLTALAPTSDEMETAVRWVILNIPGVAIPHNLHPFLNHFGHGHLAQRFPG